MATQALVRLFGKNVRRFRHARGWSQHRLAEAADIDRTYISDVERGARNPTLMVVERLAQALEVEPYELLRPQAEEAEEP